MAKKESELEISQTERIRTAIALLESQKAEIERNEVVAPLGCYVARYQARGQKHRYWYYPKNSGVTNQRRLLAKPSTYKE